MVRFRTHRFAFHLHGTWLFPFKHVALLCVLNSGLEKWLFSFHSCRIRGRRASGGSPSLQGVGVGSWAWNLAAPTPCPALMLSHGLPPGHWGPGLPTLPFSPVGETPRSLPSWDPVLWRAHTPLTSAAPAYLSLFSKQWRTRGPGGAHPVPLSSALQVWGGPPSIMQIMLRRKW